MPFRRGGSRGDVREGLGERSRRGLRERSRRLGSEGDRGFAGDAGLVAASDGAGRGGEDGGAEGGRGGAAKLGEGERACGASRGEEACSSARIRLRVRAPRSSPAIRSAAAARHMRASSAASEADRFSSIDASCSCSRCCGCGCGGDCCRCCCCLCCCRCLCSRRRRVRTLGSDPAPAARPAGRVIEGSAAGLAIRKWARIRPSTNSTWAPGTAATARRNSARVAELLPSARGSGRPPGGRPAAGPSGPSAIILFRRSYEQWTPQPVLGAPMLWTSSRTRQARGVNRAMRHVPTSV